jgi:4'-phosphopantetheinyl transferase EntD
MDLDPTLSALRKSLRAALPADIAIAACSLDCRALPLFPEELAATATMAPDRLREFAAGRDCARKALLAAGCDAAPIPVGDSRQPLWPVGFTGSITHAGRFTAAIAARDDGYAGLGLDCEQSSAVDAMLAARLLRPEELEGLRHSARPEGFDATWIFSAKESVYKCLYGQIRAFLDFQEIAIRADASGHAFGCESHTELVAPALARRVHGAWWQAAGLVWTAAWIN